MKKVSFKTAAILLATLLFTACTQTMPYPSMPMPEVMVANSFITPDSVFSCHLSLPGNIELNEYKYIPDAAVTITDLQNENMVYTLQHKDSGMYYSDTKPTVNHGYRLNIQHADYPALSATTTVPEKCLIDTVYTISEFEYSDMEAHAVAATFLTLNERSEETEYFELILGLNELVGRNNERGYCVQTILIPDDPVIDSENMKELRSYNLFFSDELFVDNSHSMKILSSSHYGGYIGTGSLPMLYMRSGSYEYYLYAKSRFKHLLEQKIKDPSIKELNIINNPVPLYGNVQGGLGVFAGYNEIQKEVYYINPKEDELY